VTSEDKRLRVPADVLCDRAKATLAALDVSEASADAATRAMLHASMHGVDSHGFRLTGVYCKMIRSGQVNPRPELKVVRTGRASMLIDADNGLGHYPSYAGIENACEMARELGVGMVGVFGSSHNGAAGTYALAGAERGYFAFSSTNADAIVALHGSTRPFHGTNPIAAAAPVPGQQPWLLDMATSSIPLNRVFLYRVLGRELSAETAADEFGAPTRDPAAADMLLPVGGAEFGFKGAGLGGLMTILCAAMTGAMLDPFMPQMSRTETSEHRNCGHFFLAIDPGQFIGREAFGNAMQTYLSALRATPAKEGEAVMAPGDREWAVAAERRVAGIPIDPETAALLGL
jgi:ureidoglycolate dehydrogenase (NAD+)